ncbi:MAG: hypothetical protein JWR61_1420 [Ferruginibacter sp.]|uniref:hypothetical protein n=1 Tax=Ferruginibacter sp. TaxID=1940288 RepID=UPI002659616B|nr:hypothetical protein [Ferruginibacter sp.]MDB5276465.1 hypothetical protein [Ferruginibacter sp.]
MKAAPAFFSRSVMIRKRKKKNLQVRPPDYRKKALEGLKAKYPYYNLKSNLLGGLFLTGALLTVWEIYIYRVTFISVYIPLSIWVLTGLLVTPIFKKVFNIYCFNPYTPERNPMFFHYFFNIVSFGGVFVFLFMWSNQIFNDNSKIVITLPIVSYGHLAKSSRSCGEPYVHIMYKDKEKELIFPCGTAIEKYRSVDIEIAKGLYGFDIIISKTIVEEQW